jgi:hypothetical protein
MHELTDWVGRGSRVGGAVALAAWLAAGARAGTLDAPRGAAGNRSKGLGSTVAILATPAGSRRTGGVGVTGYHFASPQHFSLRKAGRAYRPEDPPPAPPDLPAPSGPGPEAVLAVATVALGAAAGLAYFGRRPREPMGTAGW